MCTSGSCAHADPTAAALEGRRTTRRGLLLAGAATTTYAALATVAPAAAGTTSTRVFTGRFTGLPGEADWHYLPVRVPRGVRALEVSYSYEKVETPVGFSANVVDVGLFGPAGTALGRERGFRGWSGGARTSFRVGRGGATPGYLAGPVTPGTWRVALGPFAVVPPGVDYRVEVRLVHGPPERAARPRVAPTAVRGTGPGWYRGDLHTHTVHSDGRRTQADLVREARAAGLDFVCSTEHNTSSASLTWGRHAPDDLLVVQGEEVTTRAGHWLALGLPAGRWVDWRYRPADGQLDRFVQQVRALGGLAVVAHPHAPTPGATWGFGAGPGDWSGMDAVELANGPWTLDDEVTLAAWHARLVAGRFVPAVGSSDSHHPGQPVGRAQTVAWLPTLSTRAVVAALRAGRCWLAESSAVQLALTARLGTRTAGIGEALGAGAADVVGVRLEVGGVPGCLAQVVGPAGPLGGAVTDADGRAAVALDLPAGLVPFVRAEVRRLDGAPVANPVQGVPGLAVVALTNPVWLGVRPTGPAARPGRDASSG